MKIKRPETFRIKVSLNNISLFFFSFWSRDTNTPVAYLQQNHKLRMKSAEVTSGRDRWQFRAIERSNSAASPAVDDLSR